MRLPWAFAAHVERQEWDGRAIQLRNREKNRLKLKDGKYPPLT